jgi:hypothetical protein
MIMRSCYGKKFVPVQFSIAMTLFLIKKSFQDLMCIKFDWSFMPLSLGVGASIT